MAQSPNATEPKAPVAQIRSIQAIDFPEGVSLSRLNEMCARANFNPNESSIELGEATRGNVILRLINEKVVEMPVTPPAPKAAPAPEAEATEAPTATAGNGGRHGRK